MVRDWAKVERFDSPRRCVRCVERMVKLDANMEAVILRQSVQWHTNVFLRPGASVGYKGVQGDGEYQIN